MRNAGSRLGITLLEVLVALVVIGVTVGAARAIAEQIASSGRAATRTLDRRLLVRARENELRRTFALASAPVDSTGVFDGAINDAVLTTRCVDARGFEGLCRCRLRIDGTGASDVVLERLCDALAQPDTLITDSVSLTMLYLVDAANGGRWMREWRRTNSLPRAIGIIRAGSSDTLIVRIGERG
jgi:hypothetical protein